MPEPQKMVMEIEEMVSQEIEEVLGSWEVALGEEMIPEEVKFNDNDRTLLIKVWWNNPPTLVNAKIPPLELVVNNTPLPKQYIIYTAKFPKDWHGSKLVNAVVKTAINAAKLIVTFVMAVSAIYKNKPLIP